MSLAHDINLLSRVSLFEGFPEEQLRLLAFGSTRKFYRKGELVFREGGVSDGGYVVVEGQVDIIVERDGRDLVLSSQLADSLIGEMALITANRRVASAVARTNVELLYIPRDLFKRMLEEYPELANHLHARISSTVRELIHQLTSIQERLSGISDLTGPGLNREREKG